MKLTIAATAIAFLASAASAQKNTTSNKRELERLHAATAKKLDMLRRRSAVKNKAALDTVYIDRPTREQPADAIHKILPPTERDEILDPKVVGGSNADPGEYPFMVMVGSNGQLSCGGSLVAPNVVLCAAHCASAAQQVYIGRHNIGVSNEVGAETFNVIEVVPHPSYNPSTINNDYMMLKLSGNSQYTPIALDDGTLSPSFTGGEDLQLIGWGRTSGGGPISAILQEVELDYLTNAQCAQTWGNFITDKMLCVNRSGKSACNGDSGGPLFVYDPTGATPPVQVGVVSWGSSQCIGTPSVFARVSEEIAWINSYIDLWSGGTNPTPTPPSPTPPGTCTNDPNFIDSFGDDCSWYEQFDPTCSFGNCCDAGSGTANQACCICGGGITEPVTPVTPAPVTPAPVTPAPVTPAPVTSPTPGSGSLQDAIDLINEALEILEPLA